MTAHVTVHADADLHDPFTRFAVFRSMADQLTATDLTLDTPYGAATASIGLVTAIS